MRFFRFSKLALVLLLVLDIGQCASSARAEESLGDKIKKVFAPTPTPPPRKHRKSSTAAKKKESAEKSPSPKPTATPVETPTPSPGKKKKAASSPPPEDTPESGASASPKKKKKTSSASISPEPSSSGSPKKKKHKASSSPTPDESPSPSVTPSPNETPEAKPSPSPSEKKKGAPATIATGQISGYENYSATVRKMVDLSLDLAGRNLDYKYGSADPASGGMDCSGFVHYVLTQNGLHDVPRDASQQYVWVRKSGKFQAVVSRNEETFELNELKPGDLLFWTGTYTVEKDPPITHAMIYLGREKGSNHRVMVGASEGRTYKGESRYGVSVFDFKVGHAGASSEGRTPTFVGYGPIPGL